MTESMRMVERTGSKQADARIDPENPFDEF